MDVEASVRPRGLKRGRNYEKKLAKILGCEADLRDMCGRLVLGAVREEEFKFLAAMWWVTSPYSDGGKITVERPGKEPLILEFKPTAEVGEHGT